MIVLSKGQGIMAAKRGFVEGRDFISYDQVPLGRFDLVWSNERWIDRRTTDGRVLAADGRNARSTT